MGGRRNSRTIVPRLGGPESGADFNVVSAGYFQLIGLPVIRGRGLDSRDQAGAAEVAVVNELMARRFWPGQDPLGKRFGILRPNKVVEVVGVVRDGRFRDYRDTPRACFYLALAQNYTSRMSLEIRAPADPMRLVAATRREISLLDRDLPVRNVQTLRSYRDAGLGQERLSAALLSGLGALSVTLAAIGIYAVLAFSVARRTREIGLRMALGATATNVVGSIVRQAFRLIAVGSALGIVLSLPLRKLVSSLLYGISATDPFTYILAILVLAVAGVAAAYLPARRATRIDPLEALHHE